jgi:hypothetical protein
MKKFFSKKVRYWQLFSFAFAIFVFLFAKEWGALAFAVIAMMFWAVGESRLDLLRDSLQGWKESNDFNDKLLEENRRLTQTLSNITHQLEAIAKKERQ